MSEKTLVALGKKILGLALIFNSLVSLISALSIMYSQYVGLCPSSLYKPYLPDISLFWFVALASTLNIIPAKMLGKVTLKRILFHHYVYGFLSILLYIFLAAAFSLIHTSTLIVPLYYNIQSGETFMILLLYWGITLVIDDISDVSPRIARILNHIWEKARKINKPIMATHLISSFITIYIVLCMSLWHIKNGFLTNSSILLNFMSAPFIVNLLITSLYGLKIAGNKMWLKYH